MSDKYLSHFLILLLGMFVTGFLFFFFKYNTTLQMITALLGCVFYVVWGIIHHVVSNRMDRLIVLEYILVGSIMFLLLFISLGV